MVVAAATQIAALPFSKNNMRCAAVLQVMQHKARCAAMLIAAWPFSKNNTRCAAVLQVVGLKLDNLLVEAGRIVLVDFGGASVLQLGCSSTPGHGVHTCGWLGRTREAEEVGP
eukprot:352427-Chlamydomonas_euryale.AAC.1